MRLLSSVFGVWMCLSLGACSNGDSGSDTRRGGYVTSLVVAGACSIPGRDDLSSIRLSAVLVDDRGNAAGPEFQLLDEEAQTLQSLLYPDKILFSLNDDRAGPMCDEDTDCPRIAGSEEPNYCLEVENSNMKGAV